MSSKQQRVITREQLGVMVIRDEETVEKLFDKNYEPIIIILREGPMTIKELVEKYNELASEPKSEMTIYRYLKELAKYNLVAEVGKIITTGQSATETLYGRTAKIFWNLALKEDYWTDDQGYKPDTDNQKMIETLKELLTLYTCKNINSENLAKLMSKTANTTNNELAAFFEKNDDTINDLISGYSFKDVDKIFDLLGKVILIMNSDNFKEELQKCGC